ncbi:MAG TPA: DUF4157 domain-containing protein [Pyrinomonadaceae bacterium]|nr:DUF4157 domain-containing protein [Pyrinomonadaceae bacterium]
MSGRADFHAPQQQAETLKAADGLLQRKCACGAHTHGGAECEACAGEGRKLRRAAVSRAEASDAQPRALQDSAEGFAHDFSGTPLHSDSSTSPRPGLAVNPAGDASELEADAFAERVMRTNAAAASVGLTAAPRKIARREAAGGEAAQVAPPIVQEVLRSHGRPLDASAREWMEPRFRQDFGHVRIHADGRAAESARAVRARAYTVGADVVLGAGEYSPHSARGLRLLAHELTHVVQQRGSGAALQRQPTEAPADEKKEPAEKEGEVVNARDFAKAESLVRIGKQVAACQQAGLGKTNSGITAQSPVDGQTAQVLDEAMERASLCGSLSQYITLKSQKLSRGRFAVHQHYKGNENLGKDDASRSRFDTDDFHAAVAKYLGFKDARTDAQRAEIQKIGGFYDRPNDTVNVPSTGKFGSALHESVHRLSGLLFNQLFGHFLNEGVTQCFSDIILQDEGLPIYTGHEYGPNVQSARLLINKLGGWTLPAQIYFQNSDDAYWQAMVKLGLIPSADKRRYVSQDEITKAIKK